jgi:hypothetical protein
MIVKDDRVVCNTHITYVYITDMLKKHAASMYNVHSPSTDPRLATNTEVLQIAVAAPAEGCHGGLQFFVSESSYSYWCLVEWMGCWGLLGLLLIVIVDHSLIPY